MLEERSAKVLLKNEIMKKIFLYVASFAAMVALGSCTEDYNADVAAPQEWEQGEMVTIPDFSLTAAADINLETAEAETVQLVNYTFGELPEGGETGEVIIEVAKAAGEPKSVVEHTDGAVTVDYLQSLIEGYYGKAAELRTLSITAHSSMVLAGEVSYLKAPAAVEAKVMPKTPVIVPEFYLVGGLQGWNPSSYAVAFYPVDAKAATLSYTTNFSSYPDGSTGTPNFKIFGADQIGSWDNCYGAAIDGDTSLSGMVTLNGGAIQAPTNDIYTLSIDMLNLKYEMTLAADQAPKTYNAIGLIGVFNNWGGDAALTEVTPHNWAILGFEHTAAGELKFRANGKWDDSWGGLDYSAANYGVLAYNGGNINLPAGKYNVYFNDITCQTYFVTVE